MEDTASPHNESRGHLDAAVSVSAILRDVLNDLTSINEPAASILARCGEDGTLQQHMTDGEVRALADELIQTCQGTEDAN